MFCYKCGTENNEENKFCYKCGGKLFQFEARDQLEGNYNCISEEKCLATETQDANYPKLIRQIIILLIFIGIFVWFFSFVTSKKIEDTQIKTDAQHGSQEFILDLSKFGGSGVDNITKADRLRAAQDKARYGSDDDLSLNEKLGREKGTIFEH